MKQNPDSKVANILLGVYYLYDSSRHSTSDPAFGSLYKIAMTQYTQRAFKLDKEYPMTCASFASYFLLRKQYQTVESLARKAIEQTDVMPIASDGWYLLGRKEHYEGNTTKASEFYNRADQARGGADGGYLPAKFGVIQMQIKNRDLDGAKFRLEKIIQQTKSPECMILLGALIAEDVFAAQAQRSKEDKSADAQKAINFFESVRALWKDEKKRVAPDESVLVYLARLYESVAPEKSMQCLQQLEELQLAQIPEDERPEGIADPEAIKAELRKYLPPQLLNNIGCFLYQSDKASEARNLFQTALDACSKLDKTDDQNFDVDALTTTISYNLARSLEALDKRDEAKKLYEEVLERHADYTEANARLTYIALRQSPTDEGPKRMAKLYENNSTNLEVRALFGWYLSKSKRRAANIAEDHEQRHYKHTLQHYDKHDRYALTGMGNVHLFTARDMRRDTDQDKEKRRKMYERAVEFFDKALQLDPKNAYAAQGIAIALVDDRKDYSTAVHIFTKVRDTLRDASVYLNLGHVYAELRQFTRSIEAYETALSKDRQRDVQILACLGRVWWLKGQQENNLAAMKTALDYANRALAVAPEQIHLEFNVAFVQNQIALLVMRLPETQRTLQDVQEAAEGLEKAIATFEWIAQAKNPPYPRGSLEQRANMGRNTLTKQIERAIQSQKEYEEKNAIKLQQARAAREAELKRREEEVRKAREQEEERKRRIAEERQKLLEESQRIAEQRREAERREALAKMESEDESGAEGAGKDREKPRRKKRGTAKRKKKTAGSYRETGDEGIVSDGEESGGRAGSGSDEGEARAPKKRRLERRRSGGGRRKFKSSEFVVESDEEDEEGAETAAATSASPAAAEATADEEQRDDDAVANEAMDDLFGDDDEEDNVTSSAPRNRIRGSKRVVESDEEDEENEPAVAAGGGDQDGDQEMRDVEEEE